VINDSPYTPNIVAPWEILGYVIQTEPICPNGTAGAYSHRMYSIKTVKIVNTRIRENPSIFDR
jgi:hypothetical protein